MFELGLARILVAQIVRMGQDRSDDFLGVTPFSENHTTLEWMIRGVRPPFVVEIMKQTNGSPKFDIFAQSLGIGSHGCFDRDHVTFQAVAYDILVNKLEICSSIKHSRIGWVWTELYRGCLQPRLGPYCNAVVLNRVLVLIVRSLHESSVLLLFYCS